MLNLLINLRFTFWSRAILGLTLVTFIAVGPVYPAAYAQNSYSLPAVGTLINASPAFTPLSLKGIKIDSNNVFNLSFIVDEGNTKLSDEALKGEAEVLLRYFLTALTVPADDIWVNLSPYEAGRIILPHLGETELGREMLAQDYILKQFASSLTYPETELGKRYWGTINGAVPAGRQVGANNHSPATQSFNKVWISPGNTRILEYENSAVITQADLNVQMEEDYLAMDKNGVGARSPRPLLGRGNPAPTDNNAFKSLILPEILKDVNAGKNFARLRQVHNAVVLATWFKQHLKDSIYNQIYINKKKMAGVNTSDPAAVDKIYDQYIEAFKKGAYNYVKRDSVGANNEIAGTGTGSPARGLVYVPGIKITRRLYYSGGMKEGRQLEQAVKDGTVASSREAISAASSDATIFDVAVSLIEAAVKSGSASPSRRRFLGGIVGLVAGIAATRAIAAVPLVVPPQVKKDSSLTGTYAVDGKNLITVSLPNTPLSQGFLDALNGVERDGAGVRQGLTARLEQEIRNANGNPGGSEAYGLRMGLTRLKGRIYGPEQLWANELALINQIRANVESVRARTRKVVILDFPGNLREAQEAIRKRYELFKLLTEVEEPGHISVVEVENPKRERYWPQAPQDLLLMSCLAEGGPVEAALAEAVILGVLVEGIPDNGLMMFRDFVGGHDVVGDLMAPSEKAQRLNDRLKQGNVCLVGDSDAVSDAVTNLLSMKGKSKPAAPADKPSPMEMLKMATHLRAPDGRTYRLNTHKRDPKNPNGTMELRSFLPSDFPADKPEESDKLAAKAAQAHGQEMLANNEAVKLKLGGSQIAIITDNLFFRELEINKSEMRRIFEDALDEVITVRNEGSAGHLNDPGIDLIVEAVHQSEHIGENHIGGDGYLAINIAGVRGITEAVVDKVMAGSSKHASVLPEKDADAIAVVLQRIILRAIAAHEFYHEATRQSGNDFEIKARKYDWQFIVKLCAANNIPVEFLVDVLRQSGNFLADSGLMVKSDLPKFIDLADQASALLVSLPVSTGARSRGGSAFAAAREAMRGAMMEGAAPAARVDQSQEGISFLLPAVRPEVASKPATTQDKSSIAFTRRTICEQLAVIARTLDEHIDSHPFYPFSADQLQGLWLVVTRLAPLSGGNENDPASQARVWFAKAIAKAVANNPELMDNLINLVEDLPSDAQLMWQREAWSDIVYEVMVILDKRHDGQFNLNKEQRNKVVLAVLRLARMPHPKGTDAYRQRSFNEFSNILADVAHIEYTHSSEKAKLAHNTFVDLLATLAINNVGNPAGECFRNAIADGLVKIKDNALALRVVDRLNESINRGAAIDIARVYLTETDGTRNEIDCPRNFHENIPAPLWPWQKRLCELGFKRINQLNREDYLRLMLPATNVKSEDLAEVTERGVNELIDDSTYFDKFFAFWNGHSDYKKIKLSKEDLLELNRLRKVLHDRFIPWAKVKLQLEVVVDIIKPYFNDQNLVFGAIQQLAAQGFLGGITTVNARMATELGLLEEDVPPLLAPAALPRTARPPAAVAEPELEPDLTPEPVLMPANGRRLIMPSTVKSPVRAAPVAARGGFTEEALRVTIEGKGNAGVFRNAAVDLNGFEGLRLDIISVKRKAGGRVLFSVVS